MKALLRAVGFGIRPVVIAAGLVVVFLTALGSIYTVRQGGSIEVDPELVYLIVLAAPLLPIAVWKGEYNFRHSYLASLPVNRSGHVFVKVVAGWVWLMAMVSAFLLWMVALTVVTGGSIGVDEMRVMASDLPAGTPAEEAAMFARRWRTLPWQWAACFTGPTVAYLFGSMVVLAGSATRRWLAGIAVVFFFLLLAYGEEMGKEILFRGMEEWIERILRAIVMGRYGLVDLLAVTDAYGLTTGAGEEIPVYNDPATLGVWVIATLLWMGLAFAALLLVVWRGRRD